MGPDWLSMADIARNKDVAEVIRVEPPQLFENERSGEKCRRFATMTQEKKEKT